MAKHHYYAATAFDWAVAPTRREAIAKVARAGGTDLIKRQIKTNKGMYVWSCRVNTPLAQQYTIHEYQPRHLIVDGEPTGVAVPLDTPREFRIVSVRGHVIPED